MELSNEAREDLDALAWVAWGKVTAQTPEVTYTDRDRQMFFIGFGAGRFQVLGEQEPTVATTTCEHEWVPAKYPPQLVGTNVCAKCQAIWPQP